MDLTTSLQHDFAYTFWNNETRRSAADGLVYGIIVAIPSGMGVALSLLDQNVGGLVGVAISASLLPPAVGAGKL